MVPNENIEVREFVLTVANKTMLLLLLIKYWKIQEALMLLFSGWVYSVQSDFESSRRSGEGHFYVSPYGTFVYWRMPFSLCKTPATFLRCMMSIFST